MRSRISVLLCLVAIASCNPQEPQPEVYGTQPETTVSLLENSTATEDVPKVSAAAKTFWKPTADFWPEPSSVVEHETFWWLTFKKKEMIVIHHGQKVVKQELPGVRCIRVNKAGQCCSFVPTR